MESTSGSRHGQTGLLNLSKDELVGVIDSLIDEINVTREVKISRGDALKLTKMRSEQNKSSDELAVVEKLDSPNKEKSKSEKKRRKVEFDFSKYRQRHIAFQLQYDGSEYGGFSDSDVVATIEGHLFEALKKTRLIEERKSSCYSRCGRTDKGVSALGQLVAFNLRSSIPKRISDSSIPKHPCDAVLEDSPPAASSSEPQESTPAAKEFYEMDYCNMINNALPPDIRVLGWTEVADGFSARFSATYRTYRYFFVKKDLDILAMQKAASFLIGNHDFRNLCKMDVANVANFCREIYSATIECFIENTTVPSQSVWKFEVKGVAFLWHMVRCIVAVLFMVGENGEHPEIMKQLLDTTTNPSKPQYMMAPERPLVLHECGYDNLHMPMQPRNLWQLTAHYEAIWEAQCLSATRTLNVLQCLKERAVRSDDLAEFVKEQLCNKKERKKQSGEPPQKRIRQDPTLVKELGQDSQQGMIEWGEALSQMRSLYGKKPTLVRTPYVPLMQRKREETYEEKTRCLTGRKKEDFDRNAKLQAAHKSSNCSENGNFFKNMRKLGSV